MLENSLAQHPDVAVHIGRSSERTSSRHLSGSTLGVSTSTFTPRSVEIHGEWRRCQTVLFPASGLSGGRGHFRPYPRGAEQTQTPPHCWRDAIRPLGESLHGAELRLRRVSKPGRGSLMTILSPHMTEDLQHPKNCVFTQVIKCCHVCVRQFAHMLLCSRWAKSPAAPWFGPVSCGSAPKGGLAGCSMAAV